MTTPTLPDGKLAWGQAGSYDAIDDRMVIAALSAGRRGLVQAPTLAAAAGLVVNLGPWLAIVDAGDGTASVIGDLTARQFPVDAGGAAARSETLWADIAPDLATWDTHILTASQLVGRQGLALGTIDTPANANAASALTLTPGPIAAVPGTSDPAYGGIGQTMVVNTTAWNNLATFTIPPGSQPGTVWELVVTGNGNYNTANIQTASFRPRINGAAGSYVTLGTTAFSTNTGLWRWRVSVHVYCRNRGASMEVQTNMVVMAGANQENAAPGNRNMGLGVAGETASAYPMSALAPGTLDLQANVGGTGGSPSITSRWAMLRRIAG